MILEAIKYTRYEGKAKEWSIEGRDGGMVQFGNINLIVGKNAVGKSRTLEVIREISHLLSCNVILSDSSCATAKYLLHFMHEDNIYEYYISYESHQINDETLHVAGNLVLDRKANFISSLDNGDSAVLELDKNKIATSLYKENIFLNQLYEWGHVLRNYAFSNQIAKNYLLEDISALGHKESKNFRESISVLSLFHAGKCVYGEEFTFRVKEDMKALGYPISMIDIWESKGGYGICVQEDELEYVTSQIDMAQGMYRALSFIIQLNFALSSKVSECILIDDLGEGLDYDRSRLLIDLISKRVNNSAIQIFITTNDRYVMNKLPLKYWSVIERRVKKSIFYNYYNSQEIFDDFKYTGLNNFDFLATDFYIKGFESEQE